MTRAGLPTTRPSTLPMGVSFGGRTGHEHLVGHVEVGARQALLDGRDLQIVGQAQHGVARDALLSKPSESGGVESTPSRTTNRFAPRTLAHQPGLVEHDGLGVAVLLGLQLWPGWSSCRRPCSSRPAEWRCSSAGARKRCPRPRRSRARQRPGSFPTAMRRWPRRWSGAALGSTPITPYPAVRDAGGCSMKAGRSCGRSRSSASQGSFEACRAASMSAILQLRCRRSMWSRRRKT